MGLIGLDATSSVWKTSLLSLEAYEKFEKLSASHVRLCTSYSCCHEYILLMAKSWSSGVYMLYEL